jgi:hypothetical protein
MAKKPKPWTAEAKFFERKAFARDADADRYVEELLKGSEGSARLHEFQKAAMEMMRGTLYPERMAMDTGKTVHEKMLGQEMELVMLADPLGDGPRHLQYAVVEVRKGVSYYDVHDYGEDLMVADFMERKGPSWFDDAVSVLRYERINKTVFGHAIFELTDMSD